MPLWDSAGGNAFENKTIRQAGVSGTLLGLAQGLLSQQPGENWANALGRGFGQAGSLKRQHETDAKGTLQRGRDQKMRDYYRSELQRDQSEGHLSDTQKFLYQRAVMGADASQDAFAMATAQALQQDRVQDRDFTGRSGLLAQGGSQRMDEIGLQGQIQGGQIDQQAAHAQALQASGGVIQGDLQAQQQAAQLAYGTAMNTQQFGNQRNRDALQNQYAVAGREQMNTYQTGRDYRLDDFASQGRVEGFDLQSQLERDRVGRAIEPDQGISETHFEFGARSREHAAKLTSEQMDQQHIMMMDKIAQGQDWQTGNLMPAQTAQQLELGAAGHEQRMDLQQDRFKRTAKNEEAARTHNWVATMHLNDRMRSQRSEDQEISALRTHEFQMEQAGLGQQYKQANILLMNGIDQAMAIPGMQRAEALRNVYRQRLDNPEMSIAIQQDAEKMVNLSDAQLEQAVLQERNVLMQIEQSNQGRLARQSDYLTNLELREEFANRKEQDKRAYREGQPGFQNEHTFQLLMQLHSMGQPIPDEMKRFFDLQYGRGAVDRMIYDATSGAAYRGGGGGFGGPGPVAPQ